MTTTPLQRSTRWLAGLFGLVALATTSLASDAAAAPLIRADRPNEVSFAPQRAKFVRFVIHATSSDKACIDELEIYASGKSRNLAAKRNRARATASSCYLGNAKHAVAHLNDGKYGNDFSWIAGDEATPWVQIELPQNAEIAKVVFSRDRRRQYADRVPIHFEVLLSSNGEQWKSVKRVKSRAAPVRTVRAAGRLGVVVPASPPPPRIGPNAAIISTATASRIKVRVRDERGFVNLALAPAAKAAASSLLPGYEAHKTVHLNDGLAGNDHSWVSGANPAWAEVDLGDVYWVYHVALGSDESGRFTDRAATTFAIATATKYDQDSTAKSWNRAYHQSGGAPLQRRTSFRFAPVQARWVRVAISAANRNEARIDEIEVYGRKTAITAQQAGPIDTNLTAKPRIDHKKLLEGAILGEEHAWLKTYGRADISSQLVPYNGRVKRYPRHVGDDVLPLPPLAGKPTFDAALDDACWASASRGVVRVAYPYDYKQSPLSTHSVMAGRDAEFLYLGIRADRLLGSHVAVLSCGDSTSAAVVALTDKGLVLNTYPADGAPGKSTPITGKFNKTLTCFEMRVPLATFADCRSRGLRVGLGMGGKHVKSHGRAVSFTFSPLAIAQVGPCVGRTFRVRFSAAKEGEPVTITGAAPQLADGLRLAPGESKTIAISADRGPIGPQLDLTVEQQGGESYALRLFRYDPVERTLALMREMVDRFEAKGLDVRVEREQLAALGRHHEKLMAAASPDRSAERRALFAARLAKRRLLFRAPELRPIEEILFVKRHAFEPSHNYSVTLDARFRPGGGVYALHIPRADGRLEPSKAELRELFKADGGIPRTPMANFDRSKVYFAYRPAAAGYYHIHRMNADGSDSKQLTSGPFHDYWPCPLPSGRLAFVSSRCRARFLCWRPQAAVLFRMDANGENMRPLSFANLTEWAPSVMNDGRLIWTRSEYIDKGADFGHTLWAIRPDGTKPELVFGNDIIQPNGYANGREVPGTSEILCTLISHFGDLNGPLALVDTAKGRHNPQAITSITPEVPWPGNWPREECFRDPVPISRDIFLCSHAPRNRFALYVIDRHGNREILYEDDTYGSMCPTIFRARKAPPALPDRVKPEQTHGELVIEDVYQGISPTVKRGSVKYIRVVQEVRAKLLKMPDGQYQRDHPGFQDYYATPIHKVSGPFGWPSYVAKAPLGITPVEKDGSARFRAPAGKVLYLQALDKDFNELQRMRSVMQLQPGERRSCIGCHESRNKAPTTNRHALALSRPPRDLEPPPWGAGPFSYEKVVQPVWDAKCVSCHNASDKKINLTAKLDREKVPASYRTLISQGWVHYLDCGWNSGGTEKRPPLTFGTVKSKLWKVLEGGHYKATLTREEMRRVKCWTDLNCPLWPDYVNRALRPAVAPTKVLKISKK